MNRRRTAPLHWAALAACLCLLPVPVAAQAPAEPTHVYIARGGDTLIGIGRRLLVQPGAWPELVRINRIANPNRIAIGTAVAIPLRLLRSSALAVTVEQVRGDVRAGNTALAAGATLAEGDEVRTATDGSVVLRLADGSLLRLAAGSTLRVEAARRLPDLDRTRSGVSLQSGRVEVQTPRSVDGKPSFEVRTPQGVLGVRGTEFRVAADSGSGVTRGEVLEGAIEAAAGATARRLEAGFGTSIDAQARVAEPVPLLAAPDLRNQPALQERLVVRFAVPAQTGVVAWRGLLARDRGMRDVVADNLAQGTELRFANLDDGPYVLRVRGIDAMGLEGRDADHAFVLKARPEPPLPSAPAPGGVTRGTRVELSWAGNPEAQTYRMQLANDERLGANLRDLPGLTTTSLTLDGLAPGNYFWRLASVRAGNDQGPWGVVRGFVVRPPPATPAPPAVGDTAVQFAWEGEPGQTFDFQIARDPNFEQMVLERRLEQAGIDLPRPPGGTYYVRYRARDADGFIGPFTTPQRFEVIDCIRVSEGGCVRTGGGEPLRRP
jgi:hypothetical protein